MSNGTVLLIYVVFIIILAVFAYFDLKNNHKKLAILNEILIVGIIFAGIYVAFFK